MSNITSFGCLDFFFSDLTFFPFLAASGFDTFGLDFLLTTFSEDTADLPNKSLTVSLDFFEDFIDLLPETEVTPDIEVYMLLQAALFLSLRKTKIHNEETFTQQKHALQNFEN